MEAKALWIATRGDKVTGSKTKMVLGLLKESEGPKMPADIAIHGDYLWVTRVSEEKAEKRVVSNKLLRWNRPLPRQQEQV